MLLDTRLRSSLSPQSEPPLVFEHPMEMDKRITIEANNFKEFFGTLVMHPHLLQNICIFFGFL